MMDEKLRVRDLQDSREVFQRLDAIEAEAGKDPKKKKMLRQVWSDALNSNRLKERGLDE